MKLLISKVPAIRTAGTFIFSILILLMLIFSSISVFAARNFDIPASIPRIGRERPNQLPTIEMRMENQLPISIGEWLEVEFIATDDRGVEEISVETTFTDNDDSFFVLDCTENGRAPLICRKTLVFRMPDEPAPQRIIAVVTDNQGAVNAKKVWIDVIDEECEEDIDDALEELGELNNRLWTLESQRFNAYIALQQAEGDNLPAEEQAARRVAFEEADAHLQEAKRDATSMQRDIREQMRACNNYGPDLVITGIEIEGNEVSPGETFAFPAGQEELEFEVTYENRGTASVYGPIGFQIWSEEENERHALVTSIGGDGLESGVFARRRLHIASRDMLDTPGTYVYHIGIDRCGSMDDFLEDVSCNMIPEQDENNNVFSGRLLVRQPRQ